MIPFTLSSFVKFIHSLNDYCSFYFILLIPTSYVGLNSSSLLRKESAGGFQVTIFKDILTEEYLNKLDLNPAKYKQYFI
jgi:hypothetical protein